MWKTNFRINATSWLIGLLSLAEGERTDINRAAAIFSLFDFSGSDLISSDELAVAILCILSSFASILDRRHEIPSDRIVVKYTETIYHHLGRAVGSQISCGSFCQWVSEYFIGQSGPFLSHGAN